MRTPEHGERDVNVLGLGHADRQKLSKVLTGPKRVERPAITVEDPSLPEQLLRLAAGGRFVLVMLNRVVRARELFQRAKTLAAPDGGPEILLLHSRFRPRERAATMARLRKATSDPGRVVISTQVLEAGVDLDADVLVTELCPWPSLVQRLGRLNRRGRKAGVVHILDLPVKESTGGRPTTKSERDQAEADARREAARPYAWPGIEEARRRLNRLGGDASISALETVDRVDPYTVPVEGPVLRQHHLDDLFDTDPDLSGGHLDFSRFVRGDATDLDVAVLMKDW